MNIKNIQDPFPPHKVRLKSIYDGYRYPSPSKALEYIFLRFKDTDITVDKQKANSITITIRCGDAMYQSIKLHFVKDMGQNFIWKDLKENRLC